MARLAVAAVVKAMSCSEREYAEARYGNQNRYTSISVSQGPPSKKYAVSTAVRHYGPDSSCPCYDVAIAVLRSIGAQTVSMDTEAAENLYLCYRRPD